MKDKLCFVIGPMNEIHFPKLIRFVENVIKPVFEPLGFDVATPDLHRVGNVMSQVIESCDRAELVIADTTGHNPNVSYEIALLDALGRMCIPVKLDADDERMMFDRAAYRYWVMDTSNYATAKEQLAKIYENSLAEKERKDHFSNPMTDYYKVPVIELSPTAGLALGYCENFIKPTVVDMTKLLGEDSYNQRLYEKVVVEKRSGEEEITGRDREELMLDIVIPDRLRYATHDYIREELVQKGFIEKAKILLGRHQERQKHLYAWKNGTDKWRLLDVPTAMNVMNKSIHARQGLQIGGNQHKEFRDLEEEEIERFHKLVRDNTQRPDQPLALQTRCEIHSWTNTVLKTARVI